MSVSLTEKDKKILSGRTGAAARLAMSILVRMAEVYDAPRLMDVTQAHIDGCALMCDSGLEFAETLVARGARVSVPTTLNMIPLDLQNWRKQNVPEEFAKKAGRIASSYLAMGCVPTWTCAPYQGYLTPRFGQQIAWGESNAIVYANSVLGARTNRYGDYMDICAAITGRVPESGLHLKQNRKGQVLLRLANIAPQLLRDDTIYVALGHLMGGLVQERIPVIEGLPLNATGDQLKSLGAAAASSGAVGLFHAIGVTPEAATLEEAFQGGSAKEVIDVNYTDLRKAWSELSTVEEGARLDAIVLGCPHFSYGEFQQLARCIEDEKGRSLHRGVRVLVLTSQTSYALLQRGNFIDTLLDFGVEIALDTCVFHSPIISPHTKVIMTNSGKFAYYAPGELGVQVAFGGMKDCIHSAIEGVVSWEKSIWKRY
ncbi:MAG: aconitase X catalytic domain-containing protein [Candidatus Bipolaricaulota bacterium]|nr:aconitase X catalytic domain-containing protein [Candidatus Bipolaricaulota bacterium]